MSATDRLKVTVLMGGPGGEREVSLKSGEAVAAALRQAGHRVSILDPQDRSLDGLAEQAPDVAFLALHGGDGEDGTIQARLEELGIPYTGSGPRASRMAMDKAWSKSVFRARGIPTPEWQVCTPENHWSTLQDRVGFPLVVKPATGGSSIGVRIVETELEAQRAVSAALEVSGQVIVERHVSGREVTVGILGEQPLPAVELVVKRSFYDYEAKYSDEGGTEYLCPAPLGELQAGHARRLAVQVHRALGCRDLSRTDMILDDDGRLQTVELHISDGGREPLAADTLTISEDNVLYCLIKNGTEKARFHRDKQLSLLQRGLSETPGGFALWVGGRQYDISPA